MTDPNQRLQPNHGEVAGRVIDGEAIMIRLSDGIYYSMDKVGGFVWGLIEQQRSMQEISDAIASRFGIPGAQAQADLGCLVKEMMDERLVVAASNGQAPSVVQDIPADAEKISYQAPHLNIYRDMNDLLALDPPAPGLQDIPWKA